MLSLLRRHPEFRRIFFAHSVSRAGDAFNTVALVVLVFELTGSGRGVAATVAFEVVPVLLFGPIAGVVADRYSRRRVMIAADLARAALVSVLVLSHTSAATAFAVAFGLSTVSLLFNPAASSLVPEVVETDELVTANSALWTTAVASQIALAPLAGAVIAWFGIGTAFAVNAASYIVSAGFLARLRAGRDAGDLTVGGWGAVREGVAAVRSHPLLARLAVVQVLASLSAGATSGLLVVLAAEAFGVGASGFGVLLGAIGVGAVLGPALLRRSITPGDRRWLFGPYAVRGGVDLALAATTSPLVAGGSLVAYGMSTSTGMIAYQSTLQFEVPEQLRGRAFALFDVLWNAARLVSLGTGGLLADAIGIRAVYVVGGLLLLAAAIVGWRGPLRISEPSTAHAD
jgi:MFS family permease